MPAGATIAKTIGKVGSKVIPGLSMASWLLFLLPLLKEGLDWTGITEDSLDAATEKSLARQNREKMKVLGDQRTEAMGKSFVSRMMPDPDRLMEFATMLRSGTFDDAGLPALPKDSLVAHVAQKLGTTPEELARRTRPKSPSTLLGVDLGVY